MSQAPAFDVYIKGAPDKGNEDRNGKTLDCPFSQRVMLTLGEKNVAFNKVFLDEDNLPEWLADVHPDGKKIPVAKDLQADKWIGDSANIVKYIEEKFPDPKLGTPDSTSDVGEDIMPNMMEFLQAPKGSDDEKKAQAQMDKSLQSLEDHLAKQSGPYICGDSVCAQCMAIAPRVYHLSIATKALKGWNKLGDYPHVVKFLDAMKQRPSWGPAAPINDDVVAQGWQHKMEKMAKS